MANAETPKNDPKALYEAVLAKVEAGHMLKRADLAEFVRLRDLLGYKDPTS